ARARVSQPWQGIPRGSLPRRGLPGPGDPGPRRRPGRVGRGRRGVVGTLFVAHRLAFDRDPPGTSRRRQPAHHHCGLAPAAIRTPLRAVRVTKLIRLLTGWVLRLVCPWAFATVREEVPSAAPMASGSLTLIPRRPKVDLKVYTVDLQLSKPAVGVDNIHYDVFLSPRFVDFSRSFLFDLIRQTTGLTQSAGMGRRPFKTPETGSFRKLLVELLQASLTRAKFEKNIELDL